MSPPPTTFEERLEWALDRRGMSRRGLSLESGAAGSYLNTLVTRLREAHVAAEERGETLDEAVFLGRKNSETIRRIAARAGVSARWLETGEGSPEDGTVGATLARQTEWPGALREALAARPPAIPESYYHRVGEITFPGLQITPAMIAGFAQVLFVGLHDEAAKAREDLAARGLLGQPAKPAARSGTIPAATPPAPASDEKSAASSRRSARRRRRSSS